MNISPKDIKLGYISDAGVHSTAFASQVIEVLKEVGKEIGNISLFVLQQSLFPFSRSIKPKVKKKIENISDLEFVEIIIQKPRVLKWLMKKDSRNLAKILHDNSSKFNILHCHGVAGSYFGLLAKERITKDIPLVADLRGLVSQEFSLYGQKGNLIGRYFSSLRAHEFEKIERYVIEKSNLIFCVSANFKRYIVETYNIYPEKVRIIPTLTNSQLFFFDPELRDKKRRELGIENRPVFIYSGSIGKWHLSKATIALFKKIKNLIPDAFLLFLTPRIPFAKRYFDGINKQDYQLISIPYREVPEYLNAADIAFLLREENLVNWVASPMKFGEYLCTGLPVIITPGIDDTKEIVKKYGIGEVISLNNLHIEKSQILQLINTDRKRISKIGASLFSIEAYRSRIINYWLEVLTLASPGAVNNI